VTASYSVSRNYTGSALVGSSSTTTSSGGAVGLRRERHDDEPAWRHRPRSKRRRRANVGLDVWGRDSPPDRSNVAGAQVSAADLINAKLTAQAQLALAYSICARLRVRACWKRPRRNIKDRTITQNQYKGARSRRPISSAPRRSIVGAGWRSAPMRQSRSCSTRSPC